MIPIRFRQQFRIRGILNQSFFLSMKNKKHLITKIKKFLQAHVLSLGMTALAMFLIFFGMRTPFSASLLGGMNVEMLEPNSIWIEQDSETQDLLFKFKNGQQSVETIKIYFSVEGGNIDLNNISTSIPLWEVLPRYSAKNDYFYVGIKSSVNIYLEKGNPIDPGAIVEIMRISNVNSSAHSKIIIRTDKSYIGNKENTILQFVQPPLEVVQESQEKNEEIDV